MRTLGLLSYFSLVSLGQQIEEMEWNIEPLTSKIPLEVLASGINFEWLLESPLTEAADLFSALNGTLVAIGPHHSDGVISPAKGQCFGLGLVRAISPGSSWSDSSLFLLTPLDPSMLERLQAKKIIVGNLHLPTALLYLDPRIRTGPYADSFSLDGAIGQKSSKSRKNLKRSGLIGR